MLALEARAGGDRREAASAARTAIERAGGWVLDARLYSDVLTVLLFELPAGAGPALLSGLEQAGLRLSEASQAALEGDRAAPGAPDSSGSLQLFFPGSGQLRHDVPADG